MLAVARRVQGMHQDLPNLQSGWNSTANCLLLVLMGYFWSIKIIIKVSLFLVAFLMKICSIFYKLYLAPLELIL